MLKVQLKAKEAGFADVIYLDAVNNKYIEVGRCRLTLPQTRVEIAYGVNA